MGSMTHYMELLAVNQPWNLIIFMAIPVILAETIAVTELAILYTRNLSGKLRMVNKISSIIVGFYFLGIFVYLLFKAYIPLTLTGEWRGVIDVLSVSFYLLGVFPLLGMALLDIGLIMRNKTEKERFKYHVFCVGVFLVVAHIAMIFGMLDPTLGNVIDPHDMMNM